MSNRAARLRTPMGPPAASTQSEGLSASSSTLLAIPPALLLVVALEISRVPWVIVADSASTFVDALLLGARTALDALWAPLLYQGYLALMARARGERIQRFALIGAVVAAAGVSALSYLGLVRYPPFRGYVPFIAAFGVLASFLTLLSLVLLRPRLWADRPRLAVAARWLLPGGAFVGFAVVYVLNRELYPNLYPTLHLSMLQVAYLLLHACFALALRYLPRPGKARRALLVVIAAVVLHGVVLSVPFGARVAAPVRAAFLRHTALGRAYAMERANGTRTRPTPSTAFDPDGVERFGRLSHLPALPGGFQLERYNILLVSIEALRFPETDLSGSSRGLTPNLSAFARDGRFWFRRAYSSAPGTLQSMSSVFTCQLPSAARITLKTRWHGVLDEQETSVAELLRDRGYATFYAGHNFKEHFSPGGRIQGVHQGFVRRFFAPGKKADRRDPTLDAKVLRSALRMLDEHRRGPKRFFGWIFFESPHYPYLARYPEMKSRRRIDRYRQEIRYVDERLGTLMAYLKKHRLFDDTVVIVHADHGEAFGEHGLSGHADVYTETTHVPLVIHVPGVRGRRIDEPTSLVYLFPWLLLRGGGPLRTFAERRLRTRIGPMLKQTEAAVVSEMQCPGCSRAGLYYRNHHLIFDFASGYLELYDLRDDPWEQRNLFDQSDAKTKAFLRKHRSAYARRLGGYLSVRGATQPPQRPVSAPR